jgi:molybdenum cofactor cytidylyltransferase
MVLAAGKGSRFGADKRLAVLPGGDGRCMLEQVLATFTSVLSPVLVVLRADDDAGLRIVRACGAIPVACEDADFGMGHSLACGARALQGMKGWQGVLIGLADMPRVSPRTLTRLQEVLLAQNKPVAPVRPGAAAQHGKAGPLGHPRGLPADAVPALLSLRGDQGARHLLDWQLDALHVEVDDAGILLDVDTPDDLAAMAAM